MRMRHYASSGGLTTNPSVREDAVSMMQTYFEAGLVITPAFRPVHAGITRCQRWMKSIKGRPHRFRPELGEAGHLYITRNCVNLIEEIMEYHMSSERPGQIVDRKNDAVDAMRFGLASDLISDWSDEPVRNTGDPVQESIDNMFKGMEENSFDPQVTVSYTHLRAHET